MGFVLQIPEAGSSRALPHIYAVHEPDRGVGVVGESLLYASPAGEERTADLTPALQFCQDITRSMSYSGSTMSVAFRIAHERACNDNQRGLRRVVVGAAAMAVQGSLMQWGAIGPAGVALINRGDASIAYMATDEPDADNVTAINGDRDMIGREQVGSISVDSLRQQVVVFSGLCRPLLDDENTRKLLLKAGPDIASERVLHDHVTKGRRKHRFPDGAMSLIALATAQRQVQVRPRPQYGRGGYTGGNPFLSLGWNAAQQNQAWSGEGE